GTAWSEEQDVFGSETSLESGDHIVAREEIVTRNRGTKNESHGMSHRFTSPNEVVAITLIIGQKLCCAKIMLRNKVVAFQ
ncbi:MAG: hypothetical protein H6R23_1687, partial [Proteobacteria bacterium]|nr:hypothetical protein [Pseudomonadota bacterium]